MFAVDEEPHVLLVVAAYACTKMEVGTIDLLRVDEAELTRFGDVAPIQGTTPVTSANALHRALDWTSDDLVRLVDHLLVAHRQSTRYAPRQVLRAVIGLDPTDVQEGEHRDWVLSQRSEESARRSVR
ncbi:MAG: hypothetical protein ABTD50_22085 [Polyangiaceae bacterium]|jgi:hypothetical protein